MIEYKNNRSQIIVNHSINVEIDPLVTEYFFSENAGTPITNKGVPILPGEIHSIIAYVSGVLDTGAGAGAIAYEVRGAIQRATVADGGGIGADYMETMESLGAGYGPFDATTGLFYLSTPLLGNGAEYFFNLNPTPGNLTDFDGFIFKANVTIHITTYKL